MKPKVYVDKVGDDLIVYDIEFYPDEKAHHGYELKCPAGLVCIDVNSDGKILALTLATKC